MKLGNVLLDAGVTQWRRMSKYYHLEHLEFASNRLYQALLNYLRDKSKIEIMLNDLSEAEKRLLKAIVITQSIDLLYDYRHWRSYLNYFFNNQLEVLVQLQYRGLIYLNKDQKYFIPQEIFKNLIEILIKECLENIPENIVDSYMSTGGEIVIKDILRLLDTLNKRKIRITNNNTFYKTDSQRVRSLLLLDHENIEFSIGDKLDFLYKYIINSELAVVNKGELCLTKKGLLWHNTKPIDMWKDLIKYWVVKYPTNSATRVANSVLLGLIMRIIPQNITLSLSKFNNIYLNNGGITPLNINRDCWLKNTINELVYLGLLYRGVSNEDIKVNQKLVNLYNSNSTEWMSDTSFIAQPNLEILISLHARPDIHWKLASFCQDNGGKEMYRYQLTKESIYNALLRGWNLMSIIDFLENSSTEIPHNIRQALHDFGGKFGKIYLMETFLICCKTEAIAKELMHIPELASYIEGLINKRTIVVTRDNHIKLINKLESLGYMPYQDVFGSNDIPFSTMLEEDKHVF